MPFWQHRDKLDPRPLTYLEKEEYSAALTYLATTATGGDRRWLLHRLVPPEVLPPRLLEAVFLTHPRPMDPVVVTTELPPPPPCDKAEMQLALIPDAAPAVARAPPTPALPARPFSHFATSASLTPSFLCTDAGDPFPLLASVPFWQERSEHVADNSSRRHGHRGAWEAALARSAEWNTFRWLPKMAIDCRPWVAEMDERLVLLHRAVTVPAALPEVALCLSRECVQGQCASVQCTNAKAFPPSLAIPKLRRLDVDLRAVETTSTTQAVTFPESVEPEEVDEAFLHFSGRKQHMRNLAMAAPGDSAGTISTMDLMALPLRAKSLTSLALRHSAMNNEAVQVLAAMTSLRHLDLTGAELLSDLRPLAALKAELRSLDLTGCISVGDDAMRPVSLLAFRGALRKLCLARTVVTDAGLAWLNDPACRQRSVKAPSLQDAKALQPSVASSSVASPQRARRSSMVVDVSPYENPRAPVLATLQSAQAVAKARRMLGASPHADSLATVKNTLAATALIQNGGLIAVPRSHRRRAQRTDDPSAALQASGDGNLSRSGTLPPLGDSPARHPPRTPASVSPTLGGALVVAGSSPARPAAAAVPGAVSTHTMAHFFGGVEREEYVEVLQGKRDPLAHIFRPASAAAPSLCAQLDPHENADPETAADAWSSTVFDLEPQHVPSRWAPLLSSSSEDDDDPSPHPAAPPAAASPLEELSLAECRGVTNDGLCDVVSLMQSLRGLCLAGCQAVTDDGIRALRSLTALEHLDLSDCHRVTDYALRKVLWTRRPQPGDAGPQDGPTLAPISTPSSPLGDGTVSVETSAQSTPQALVPLEDIAAAVPGTVAPTFYPRLRHLRSLRLAHTSVNGHCFFPFPYLPNALLSDAANATPPSATAAVVPAAESEPRQTTPSRLRLELAGRAPLSLLPRSALLWPLRAVDVSGCRLVSRRNLYGIREACPDLEELCHLSA